MVFVCSFVSMSPAMVRTVIVQEQARYLERSSLCLFSLKKKKKDKVRGSALGSLAYF